MWEESLLNLPAECPRFDAQGARDPFPDASGDRAAVSRPPRALRCRAYLAPEGFLFDCAAGGWAIRPRAGAAGGALGRARGSWTMRPHECCGCRRATTLPSRRSVLAAFACAAIASPLFADAAAAQSPPTTSGSCAWRSRKRARPIFRSAQSSSATAPCSRADATSDAPRTIRPRMARWSRFAPSSPSASPRRCTAPRSTPPASLARCAWARSCGVASAGWCLRRR